jgi:Sec-independent protein secretion pathway component TatC
MMIAVKEMRESDAAACEKLIENVTQLEKIACIFLSASTACMDFLSDSFLLLQSKLQSLSTQHEEERSKLQLGQNPTQNITDLLSPVFSQIKN